MALTWYFSVIWGSKCRKSLRALIFQFPLNSCSTENVNHLMFAAVPCSTDLKWQFNWVGDCFCNWSGNKEITKVLLFFFIIFFLLPKPPACWGRKTPGIIFHQCLTQPFLSSVAFPSLISGIALKTAPSSSPQLLLFTGIVSSFPAECNFLEKKESSTWSNISTEICYSSQSCLASYKLPHEIQLCEF